MSADVLMIPVSDVADAIGRAAARVREREAAEELRARGGVSARHPAPSKDECWQAWAKSRMDRDEPLDEGARAAFEEWWTAGVAVAA